MPATKTTAIPAHLMQWLDRQIEQEIATPCHTMQISDPAAVEAITADIRERWVSRFGKN